MFTLIILVLSGTILGAFGGSFFTAADGLLTGSAAGMIFGSAVWYVLGTIERIQHERRLDSFFYQNELTPHDFNTAAKQ